METISQSYCHTHKAPPWVLGLLFFGWVLPIIALTVSVGINAGIGAGFYMGIAVALIIGTFHHLTVEDQGEKMAIRFGPLPLFRKSFKYADIKKAEVGRTFNWPIQMTIKWEWVWNPGGFDCVVVHLKKGVLRIGTDDAENLAKFLEGKISLQQP